MKLPNLPFLEKKQKSEFFLSLVLRDEKASAVVFEEVNGRINVVGEHFENFKDSIENASEEELLNVVDKAVSTAEQSLPEGVESQKTIFGVKQDWVVDGKINKDYLAKLKKLSDALSFKPMGFLVIPEAISHLLQKEEGAPVSAIFVETEGNRVSASLVKAGRILETKTALIEGDSISNAIDLLIKHFTSAEILPSRIILISGGNEKLVQELTAHKWSHELGFLHIPKISALPLNFDARAVLNGAAMQMGFDVLEASLKSAEKEDKTNIDDQDTTIKDANEDKTLAEVASEFGFVEKDIKADKAPKTAVDDLRQSDNIKISDQFREIPEEVKLKTADSKPFPINAATMALLIKYALGKIHLGKMIRFVGASRKRFLLVAFPLFLIFLIIIFYVFLRSAIVTLDINPRETDKTENITFSESEVTDASKNIISAEFLKVSEDGKKSIPTTGKKETGDKAKGTVTIFNNNDTGKTIPTGTTLMSPNNLKFLTDKAVTVASASGDIFSGTEPGKANVSVTAEKFGTNYNFPSNTKFSIEGASSIAAKNDEAFSGGTKKEIKVVSRADVDKLTKDLQKQLEAEAKTDILKKAKSDSVTLPNFISITFDRKSFNKDVDEEANELSLTATVSFLGISYKKSELVSYAKDKLKKSVEEGMTIDEDRIDVQASDIKKDKTKTSAKIKIKAGLIPLIDEKGLSKQIAGNSIEDATKKLSEIPEVNNVKINVFLNLPVLPKNLPFSSGKIKIVVNKNG